MIISVLGMHRSGTSCLAGILQAAGLYAGEVITFAHDNLRGNRENQDIMNLNDAVLAHNGAAWDAPPAVDIRWTDAQRQTRDALIAARYTSAPHWLFKDPRTLLTLPFWEEEGRAIHHVGTFRHPFRVALSLYARSAMPLSQGIALWLAYNTRLLAAYERAAFPLVCFDVQGDDYLAQIPAILHLLQEYTAIPLSLPQARDFYSASLVHQRETVVPESERAGAGALLRDAEALYAALEKAAGLSRTQANLPSTPPLLRSDDAAVQERLADAVLLQQPSEALAHYRKAVALVPQHAGIRAKLVKTLAAQQHYTEASAVAEEGRGLLPDNPLWYEHLGDIPYAQQDWAAAIPPYQRLIVLAPGHPPGFQKLLHCLLEKAQHEAARTLYQTHIAPRFADYPALFMVCGQALRNHQHTDLARDAFERAIQHGHPQPWAVYSALGETCMRRQEWQEADQALDTAITLKPDNAHAYHLRSNLYRQQGKMAEALACLQKAAVFSPGDKALHLALGDMHRQQGAIPAAILAYQTVVMLG